LDNGYIICDSTISTCRQIRRIQGPVLYICQFLFIVSLGRYEHSSRLVIQEHKTVYVHVPSVYACIFLQSRLFLETQAQHLSRVFSRLPILPAKKPLLPSPRSNSSRRHFFRGYIEYSDRLGFGRAHRWGGQPEALYLGTVCKVHCVFVYIVEAYPYLTPVVSLLVKVHGRTVDSHLFTPAYDSFLAEVSKGFKAHSRPCANH